MLTFEKCKHTNKYNSPDMKVIFLDIDGVLNTDNGRAKRSDRGLPTRDKYEELFDEDAVANLRLVLEAVPEALIVIESAWKTSLGGLPVLREMWKFRNMPGRIHSVTEDLKSFPELLDLDLSDMDNFAKVMGLGKGYGIKKWIEEHAAEEIQYVIIDDVPDFLPEQRPHVVCPNSFIGLSRDNALEAIGILNMM